MILIAHRGIHNGSAENSAGAVRKALEGPGDGVEVDARKLADGTVIMFHDDRIYSPGSGPANMYKLIESLSLQQLQSHANFDVLTLSRLLDILPINKKLIIECKPHRNNDAFRRRLVAKINDYGESLSNVILSSENLTLLRDLSRATDLGTAPVLRKIGGFEKGLLRNVNWTEIHLKHTLCDTDTLDALRSLTSGPIISWTVNTHEKRERLETLGVDGIMTDNVELLDE